MNNPLISIIIPTYNRPHLLQLAVESALAQTIENFEVIVVDDASPEPVNLPEHPKLRIIRQPDNKGGSAARNVGAKAAKGDWITYLDDDDILLPHMVEVSLEALANSTLPKPVAAISGLQVVSEDGRVQKTRIPPTLPKGSHYCLEEIEQGKSFHCKQTMVVEKDVLLSIGGFDESFSSRVHTELFLRLNQVCSLQGISTVTYKLLRHQSYRVSSDTSRRQLNFNRLISKHRTLFETHPKMFANFVYEHAIKSYDSGQTTEALKSLIKAIKIHPIYTLMRMTSPMKNTLLGKLPKARQKLLNQN